MKRTGHNGSRVAVIIGDTERQRGAVTVRNLRTGEQAQVPADQVVTHVEQILHNPPAG